MKDLYQILGVTRDATSQELKKAYRKLALVEHPDKGGDGSQMGLITQAYQILLDPQKRTHFDENWRAFQEADVEEEQESIVRGYLKSGDALPYSYLFRQQHHTLMMQYERTPLVPVAWPTVGEPFKSGLYHLVEEEGGQENTIHDIFTLICKKTEQDVRSQLPPKLESVEPSVVSNKSREYLGFLTSKESFKPAVLMGRAKSYFSSYLRSSPLEHLDPLESKEPEIEALREPLTPTRAIKLFT